MSHLRILIRRVDDTDDQMTELARFDLPAERPTPHGWSPICLDRIEATVARGASGSWRGYASCGGRRWKPRRWHAMCGRPDPLRCRRRVRDAAGGQRKRAEALG